MKGIGIGEAARRSGLTREQIIYLDEQGYLGPVARHNGARCFSEDQVQWLERFGPLRRVGLPTNHAAALATAQKARGPQELEMLCVAASATVQEIQRSFAAWMYLSTLISRSGSPATDLG